MPRSNAMSLPCDHIPCDCESECAYLKPKKEECPCGCGADSEAHCWKTSRWESEDSVDRIYYESESIGEQ